MLGPCGLTFDMSGMTRLAGACPLDGGVRARLTRQADKRPGYCLHHCCSHGIPSWFPSIFTPGQFFRKNVASAHEVICEQYVRPSHLNWLEGLPSTLLLGEG
jgi:hypothetical protein